MTGDLASFSNPPPHSHAGFALGDEVVTGAQPSYLNSKQQDGEERVGQSPPPTCALTLLKETFWRPHVTLQWQLIDMTVTQS